MHQRSSSLNLERLMRRLLLERKVQRCFFSRYIVARYPILTAHDSQLRHDVPFPFCHKHCVFAHLRKMGVWKMTSLFRRRGLATGPLEYLLAGLKVFRTISTLGCMLQPVGFPVVDKFIPALTRNDI